MDWPTLEVLIQNREHLDLIDVRPKNEFAAMHIPGALSLPLAELSQPHLFRKMSHLPVRVYVISDDRGSSSLAAGILRASHDVDAVVVDGGMKAWLERGLPIRRAGFSLKIPTSLRAVAVILAIAGIGFAFSQPWASIAALIIGAAFLLEAQLLEKTGQPGRKGMITGNEQPVAC